MAVCNAPRWDGQHWRYMKADKWQCARHLDEAHDLVMLVLAHNWTHAAVLCQWVTLLDGLSPLLQLLKEGRSDALLHQKPRGGTADLAIGPEDTKLHTCKSTSWFPLASQILRVHTSKLRDTPHTET